MASTAPQGVGSTQADERLIRRCKFRAKSGAAVGEMLFVPKDTAIAAKKLAAIVKEQWKLPPPNMLVNLDAGSAHPLTLATELLLGLPQFERWIASAHASQRAQTKRRQSKSQLLATGLPRPGTRVEMGAKESMPLLATGQESEAGASESMPSLASAGDSADDPNNAVHVVNRLLFQKLVQTFSTIVDAACMSNNWIVFDRTRPEGASPTAELLLELAMERTQQRPVVIVIDSVERIKKWSHKDANAQVELIEKIRQEDSVPIGSETEHTTFTSNYDGSCYKARDFGDCDTHPVYAEKGYSEEVADLPCKPVEAHVSEKTGKISKKRVWQYYYQMTLFGGGSHYVLLGDTNAIFPINTLAPTGSVCAHGGTAAYSRLRGLVMKGMPTVMLYNSGGVTQAFSSVHNAIMCPGAEEEDGNE
jgi:hypothetical protein